LAPFLVAFARAVDLVFGHELVERVERVGHHRGVFDTERQSRAQATQKRECDSEPHQRFPR
jgi:hypothetical protein